MTLEFTEIPSPVTDREVDAPSPHRSAVLPPSFKRIKEIYNEDFEKQRWENEGGVDPHGADRNIGQYGNVDENPILEMVVDALDQLDDGAFDDAIATINLAVEHSASCKSRVGELLDYAIRKLTTLGSPADPPHPGARKLVLKREKLAL